MVELEPLDFTIHPNEILEQIRDFFIVFCKTTQQEDEESLLEANASFSAMCVLLGLPIPSDKEAWDRLLYPEKHGN